MDIKKDRDQIVYYHNGKEDLKTKEKEFEALQIGGGYLDYDPIRICPRLDPSGEHEYIWHILLLNTGDKTKDTETLKKALEKFKREFREEL